MYEEDMKFVQQNMGYSSLEAKQFKKKMDE